jgi:hypothetical protein
MYATRDSVRSIVGVKVGACTGDDVGGDDGAGCGVVGRRVGSSTGMGCSVGGNMGIGLSTWPLVVGPAAATGAPVVAPPVPATGRSVGAVVPVPPFVGSRVLLLLLLKAVGGTVLLLLSGRGADGADGVAGCTDDDAVSLLTVAMGTRAVGAVLLLLLILPFTGTNEGGLGELVVLVVLLVVLLVLLVLFQNVGTKEGITDGDLDVVFMLGDVLVVLGDTVLFVALPVGMVTDVGTVDVLVSLKSRVGAADGIATAGLAAGPLVIVVSAAGVVPLSAAAVVAALLLPLPRPSQPRTPHTLAPITTARASVVATAAIM